MRTEELHAGIICAGNGERLRRAYPELPKALVPVSGRPLIYWVVSSLLRAGARRITCLLNSSGAPTRDYLLEAFPNLPWDFLTQDTASSWESFRRVGLALAQRSEAFWISTADCLMSPGDLAHFAAFCRRARMKDPDLFAALALTRFVEDEKPLWADVNASNFVTALGREAAQRRWVTCGLYALRARATAAFPSATAHASLREFWISRAREGRRILGVALGKTVDVDRPEDVATAERFLSDAAVALFETALPA
ncbi:MAG: NTP transferase domain-containing protein [Elusimicrobia bacterium]|nr:NTP transferase domain-containing protein [Elusimicrobiota bacterium]